MCRGGPVRGGAAVGSVIWGDGEVALSDVVRAAAAGGAVGPRNDRRGLGEGG